MQDLTKKQQFVELRAKGKSFAKISDELEVSKTTLIDWSKDLAEEITNLKQIELESIREQYKISREHRIKLYSEQLELIRGELSTRKLNDVPTGKLIDLLFRFSDIINKEDVQPVFARTTSGFTFDEPQSTDRWSA
ncbi:MAG: hypothetical protein WCP93_01620 [Candidatus Berkelbacteria bacterium]